MLSSNSQCSAYHITFYSTKTQKHIVPCSYYIRMTHPSRLLRYTIHGKGFDFPFNFKSSKFHQLCILSLCTMVTFRPSLPLIEDVCALFLGLLHFTHFTCSQNFPFFPLMFMLHFASSVYVLCVCVCVGFHVNRIFQAPPFSQRTIDTYIDPCLYQKLNAPKSISFICFHFEMKR